MSRGRPAVSGEEIQKVQNLIERCMQQYMTQVRYMTLVRDEYARETPFQLIKTRLTRGSWLPLLFCNLIT